MAAARTVVVLLFVAAGGAALAEGQGEHPVARWLNDHSREVMAGTAATMLLAGGDETSDAAERAFDAMISAGAANELVASVVDAPRPGDPEVENAFPSSHATVAFAFARAMCDWRSDGAPGFYAFASAVSWASVEGEHDSIDQVLAGAALGYWIADRSLANGGFLIHAPEKAHSGLHSTARPGPPAPRMRWTIWETQW